MEKQTGSKSGKEYIRVDLGDSIGNAFANSYEMLSELGIEII